MFAGLMKKALTFVSPELIKGLSLLLAATDAQKNWTDKNLFDDGLNELIIRVKPKAIIIYGTLTDSAKVILKKHNQDYIVFRSDTDVAMEESHHGNEG